MLLSKYNHLHIDSLLDSVCVMIDEEMQKKHKPISCQQEPSSQPQAQKNGLPLKTSAYVQRDIGIGMTSTRCCAKCTNGQRCKLPSAPDMNLCKKHASAMKDVCVWPEDDDYDPVTDTNTLTKKGKKSKDKEVKILTPHDIADLSSSGANVNSSNHALSEIDLLISRGNVVLRKTVDEKVFWPGTYYRVQSLSEPFVIGKEPNYDSSDSQVEPLDESDISYLTSYHIPFKIIDFKERAPIVLPKYSFLSNIMKQLSIDELPKTTFVQTEPTAPEYEAELWDYI